VLLQSLALGGHSADGVMTVQRDRGPRMAPNHLPPHWQNGIDTFRTYDHLYRFGAAPVRVRFLAGAELVFPLRPP
jgi:hypothetical protein